jgi:hypothetical protein
MANQDRVNFVWAESALTTIPPIPVSEVAYRDTTQTPEQMEVGQQYDTIYNSARHNQLLFLLTSVAKTLCENGIMPFLAGQEYSQYARCIFTDGKLYTASRAILANEQPYPTPGDDSGVWIAEETSENLVPNSRRVIAGTGLTGGGPLSSDVTLSAKLDGKTTRADAGGVITVKDVAIGGDLGDLASARGQIGDARQLADLDFNMLTVPGFYRTTGNPKNGPIGISGASIGSLFVSGMQGNGNCLFQIMVSGNGIYWRTSISGGTTWEIWNQVLTGNKIGDGIRNTNGIISVPEMQGATASTSGTSGLVPPAAAGQQESFLTGGGEYKPALGFTPVQQGGGTGQGSDKIYIGYSDSGLKAQADTLDLGNIVTTSAGCTKAPNAEKAKSLVVTDDGQTAKFNWTGRYTGQPEWVWGGNAAEFGNMYTWNPTNFSVNYANSAGSAATANTATGLTYTFTTNSSLALPPGGTWFVLSWSDGDRGTARGNWSGGQIVAGGSSLGVSNGAFALRVA